MLHVEGSYIHNLEEFWPYYWNNWRLDYNREFRGDVYATHGLGPACQLLNIHRGDRMKTLVAMDTKAVTGPELVKQYQKEEAPDFQNGDHTMTFIRTENGKTIHIQHDVIWIESDGYLTLGLTLKDLAEISNTNRTYLSAYIKQTYQLSFREWIASLRLEYAKRMLLQNPELTIADIAEKSGFQSASHFIRLFKENENCSPARWRKNESE